MYGYERSYKTGRAVTSWLEFIGWVIVVLGVVVALAGFASGGFMGMASRNLGGGDTPFLLRIILMVPGVLVAAGGLMSVMLAQHTKATIDTSEMTRELLMIARGEGGDKSGNTTTMASAPSKTQHATKLSVHKGKTLYAQGDKIIVDGKSFDSVADAEKFIDGR